MSVIDGVLHGHVLCTLCRDRELEKIPGFAFIEEEDTQMDENRKVYATKGPKERAVWRERIIHDPRICIH